MRYYYSHIGRDLCTEICTNRDSVPRDCCTSKHSNLCYFLHMNRVSYSHYYCYHNRNIPSSVDCRTMDRVLCDTDSSNSNQTDIPHKRNSECNHENSHLKNWVSLMTSIDAPVQRVSNEFLTEMTSLFYYLKRCYSKGTPFNIRPMQKSINKTPNL